MRADKGAFGIDANVMLRYILKDDVALSPKAKTVIDAMDDGSITVHCDPVMLAEVVWVLKSFYKTPPATICDVLKPILESKGFIVPNKARYIRALELYSTSIPHFGDACACAAALETCEGKLFSFDKELSGVGGITRLEAAPAG